MPAEVPSSDWKMEIIEDFTRGINTSVRSDAIEKGEALEAENLVFEQRIVRIDTGYKTFGAAVRGAPRASYQFFTKAGASHLTLVTQATFYVWSGTEWQYVSDGTSTTCTAGEPAGETSIVVASISGFGDADFIGIILDDGTQHRTTINGAPSGNTIVIDDGIPSGRSVDVGAPLIKAIDLSGSDDIPISIVTLPSHDWMVFTNGVDTPKRFDGTTVEDISNLPSGGNTICRLVALNNNHLVLLNTIEGGTSYPQRVRRSDTGNPEEWVTGNAGYDDLYDSEDFIVAYEELGPYGIIYRERSLIRMEYEASDFRLFFFESVVTGEGALNQDSVINLGDSHIIFGNANIYEYRGGFSLEPIGEKIYYEMFGVAGQLNPAFRGRMFAFYVEELDEVWFFFPAESSEKPNKVLRHQVGSKAWYFRTVGEEFAGYGFYQLQANRKWNALVGSWLDQTWQWRSSKLRANSPTTLLCGAVDQVYEYDYVENTDNGTEITWVFETKDFSAGNGRILLDSVRMKAKGSFLLEYSTDLGANWDVYENLTLGGSVVRKDSFLQVDADRIRFRFSGTAGGFALHWFGFRYRVASEY